MLPNDQACGGEKPISLHIYASEPYMGTRAHAANGVGAGYRVMGTVAWSVGGSELGQPMTEAVG
jgi:hypothetical protein